MSNILIPAKHARASYLKLATAVFPGCSICEFIKMVVTKIWHQLYCWERNTMYHHRQPNPDPSQPKSIHHYAYRFVASL